MRFLWLLILSYSLFTRFLSLLILSCFFVCFLLLWLCTVSTCFTFAKSEFVFIPLHEDVMGFLPYIRLGLPNPFAFFSLHLFTTLGWAWWPFCFLFTLFFHHIGLGLLTLLLSFLFNYYVGPHLLGSILFLYLWVFLIPILLIKKGLLLLIFILNITLLPKRGLWAYLWALFFILKILFFFSPSLGPHLCILFSLGH